MAEAALVRLKLRDPGGVEREVSVEADVIRIGRARDCELALDSSYISRYHARLERSGPIWQVIDEGSKNGVILNGKRISGSHALFGGDVLRLGDYTLTFDAEPSLDYDRTVAFPFSQMAERPAAAPAPASDSPAAEGVEPSTMPAATVANANGEAPPDGAAAIAPPEPAPLATEEDTPRPASAGNENVPTAVLSLKRIALAPDLRMVTVDGRTIGPELTARETAAVARLTADDGAAPALELGDAIWGAGGWDEEMLARALQRLSARLDSEGQPRLAIVADEEAGFRLVLA